MDGQTIRSLFVPPIGKTKFHELVNEGKVARASTGKGNYFLHASCRNLGLEVPSHLNAMASRSREDVCRWAFPMIDSLIFPTPGWVLEHGSEDLPRAGFTPDTCPTETKIEPAPLKLALLQGLIDAASEGRGDLADETMRTRLKDGPVVLSIEDLDGWLQATDSAQIDKDD